MERRCMRSRSTRACFRLSRAIFTNGCRMQRRRSENASEAVERAGKELDSALAELRRAVAGLRGRRWPANDDAVRGVLIEPRVARRRRRVDESRARARLRHAAHEALSFLQRALEPVSDFVRSVFRR